MKTKQKINGTKREQFRVELKKFRKNPWQHNLFYTTARDVYIQNYPQGESVLKIWKVNWQTRNKYGIVMNILQFIATPCKFFLNFFLEHEIFCVHVKVQIKSEHTLGGVWKMVLICQMSDRTTTKIPSWFFQTPPRYTLF